MRRLARWTLNAVTALSLLLCGATCLLWVRSYRPSNGAAGPDSLDVTRSEPLYWFVSNAGRLTLCRQEGKDWQSPRPAFNVLGLEFARSTVGNSSLWNLLVPYWMLAALTATSPLAAGRSRIRRRGRRPKAGACVRCSYDLTGNVSGVCPECGTAIAKGA